VREGAIIAAGGGVSYSGTASILLNVAVGISTIEVTMDPIITALIAQVGLSITASLATEQIRSFFIEDTDIVRRSIQVTCGRFPEVQEGTEEALLQWTSSEAFIEFFGSIHAGARNIDDDVVTSFIHEGGFVLPLEEECRVRASEIITTFLSALLGALYRSDEGLSVVANRMEEMHAEGQTNLHELQTQISDLKNLLVVADQPARQDTSPDLANRDLISKIDFARDLINRGLIHSARTELDQIQRDTIDIPPELKFRIVTNLGSCALADEDFESAQNLLEEAYYLQPDNVKALSNAAVAANLGHDSERAIELARKTRDLDPSNPQATAVLIAELMGADKEGEVERLIATEEWIVRDSQCGLVLASTWAQKSRLEDAVTLCRSIIEIAPREANAHLALSQFLFNQAQNGTSMNILTEESLSLLREAETEANHALEILRDTQLSARRQESYLVRGLARILLGAMDEAWEDLNEVLSENPGHPDAIFNKGLLLLHEDRIGEARRAFESLQDSARYAETVLPLADASFASGDARLAVELLKGTVVLDDPDWKDVRRAEVLYMAEAKVGAEDSVGPLLDTALARKPDNPRLLTVAAVRREILGDGSDSEELLKRALEYAEASDRLEIQLRLGAHYYALGCYAEAADCLAQVVNKLPSHPAATQLLACLVNSKRLREALDWARAMRNALRQPPRVALEVEAQILDHVGDLPAALLCLQDLCSRVDSAGTDYVKLASVQFRNGNHEAALKTILGISVSDLRHDPHSILALAQMKLLLGQSDYLNDAYLARRYRLDDPSAHLGYFTMFLGRDKDWVEPETIGPGCAVLLKNETEERWWQILEDGEDPNGPYDIRRNHDLAQRLMGRTVGDTIVLREGMEDLSYEVTALQSKYVRAFQETSAEFTTRFPGNMEMHRIEIKKDDFTKLFQNVEKRDQFVRRVGELYRQGRLPFASFASLIGRSVVEVWQASVWHAHTANDFTRIRFGTGSTEDAEHARILLDEADVVVLDLLALLTVYKLGIIEDIKRRFHRVAVPQYVIDELQKVYGLAIMNPAPAGWLGKGNDGEYTLVEMAEEGWTTWREHVGSLLAFAQSLDRMASYPLLETEDPEKIIETLTPAGAGAAYAGDEQTTTNHILVCDDLGLTQFSRSIGVKAVNTQAILQELNTSTIITNEAYSTWIEELVLLNYWFVQVRSEDIFRRLEANGYITTDGTRAMFGILEGPDCSEDSAVTVTSEIIVQLAGRAPRGQVELLLFLVIGTLRRGRNESIVLSKLQGEIASKLALAPPTRDWLLQAIEHISRVLYQN